MTVRELHKEFKVFLDKVDTEALPDFISSEIDIFLNEAQHRYVNELHLMRSTPRLVDAERRRIDNILSKLVVPKLPITITSGRGTLPTDYLTYITTSVLTGSNEVLGMIYNHLDGETEVRDPFNKPTKGYPVITFSNNELFLLGGGSTVNLTYLRYPTVISYSNNTTCELPESTHRDIVKIAVKVALETIESPRSRQ